MTIKIQQQIEGLLQDGFVLVDETQVRWYLEKVWYHRLFPYFRDSNKDIQKVISLYIFDKRLRLLVLDMLEVIENAIKGIVIHHIWSQFEDNEPRYQNAFLYEENYSDNRLMFIKDKIEDRKKNDITIKTYYKYNPNSSLPDYLFFDKLTFGELVKILKEMRPDYQKVISAYFWINSEIFMGWIFCLKYLRNLCSHYEYLYNRKMTFHLKSKVINEGIWNQNSFLSYFALLSLFNKILIPNFHRTIKVLELIKKFDMKSEALWLQTKNLPSELESEAWEVLVNSLYIKYIKKSNKSW